MVVNLRETKNKIKNNISHNQSHNNKVAEVWNIVDNWHVPTYHPPSPTHCEEEGEGGKAEPKDHSFRISQFFFMF